MKTVRRDWDHCPTNRYVGAVTRRRTRPSAIAWQIVVVVIAFPPTSRSADPPQQHHSSDAIAQEAASVANQLKQRFEMNALDAIRLHLWSRFGTVERFARDLDVSTSAL